MSPEGRITEIDFMSQAVEIRDELLTIEEMVQAGAHAVREQLLQGEEAPKHGYEAAPSELIAKLVDTRILTKDLIIVPEEVNARLPLTISSALTTLESREKTEAIIRHEDDRLIVVAGPCSIHDAKAAAEYAEKVKAWREEYGDDLEILMRFYIEKPRSEKDWKGLISDPKLDETDDINLGIVLSRLLACYITDRGVPLATERLNANTPQFLNGLITEDVIGARNSEDQKAREYGSGTSSVLGFKHNQAGDINSAIQAIISAYAAHAFVGNHEYGMMAQVNTTGNDTGHVILRGGKDGPNYTAEHVTKAKEAIEKAREKHPYLNISLGVDASHANSGKKAENQHIVIEDLARQIALGETAIVMVMMESNLVAGAQKLRDQEGNLKNKDELVYGQSITDECIDLEETEQALALLAGSVRTRRRINSGKAEELK